MQAPGIGQLLPHRLVLVLTLAVMPGLQIQGLDVVAEVVGRRTASTAGIFSLSFGWQAIEASGLGAQPHAIHFGCELGYSDGGAVFLAHAKGHGCVGGALRV